MFATDRPGYTEAVGHPTKALGPECGRKRHRDLTVLTQRGEGGLGLFIGVILKCQHDAFASR